MHFVVGRNDDARADRLFPQIILQNSQLESATNNLNLGMRAELTAKDIAELPAFIYENQSHSCASHGNSQTAIGALIGGCGS